MSSRTHYLSLLVVLCAAFPAQLFRVGLALLPGPAVPASRVRALFRGLWLPGAFLLVAALVWYAAPASGVMVPPAAWWWCVVAVVAGLAAPALEVAAGAAVALLRRARPARVRLHERASAGGVGLAGAAAAAGAVAVAVAEEVIFRGVLLYLLVHPLAVAPAAAVVLSAALYGLNHLYFGWLTVLQKGLTGVLLGVLCVAAGYSLLVPLLAHVAQNLLVMTVLPRWGRAGARAPAGAGSAYEKRREVR